MAVSAPVSGRRASGFAPALTSFVGRGDELDRLTRMLAGHRLVTVTGPGGVGKTRLAAEATRQLAARFGERVWLVELAAVQDPRRVAPAVAARLDVQQRAGFPLVQSVAQVLAGERSLLVLDNCEHVVAAVAEFCAELLSLSDDARILATSREPIGVVGEARLRLGPLHTDVPGGPRRGGADGVALFVDRVRLLDPAFDPSAEAAAAVSRIVARLDGLPLAIELAAARCESLGLAAVLQRLDAPLDLLAEGARTAPARQRSLWATVDWSYRLLAEPQRRVFRRVAVVPGPFTLRAAEAVAGSPAESAVLHLVDCSLLAPPTVGVDGAARYLMLDSVRAFALGELAASGEREDASAAMAGHAVTVAEGAAAGMRTAGGEAAAAARCDADDALLDQALTWALDHDSAAALRLAVALSPWWQLRGRAVTGYPLLHRALQACDGPDGSWLAAQIWLGRLAHSTSAFQRALTHFTAACAGLPPNAASTDLVDGLAGRSGTLRNLGRLAEASHAAHTALDLARQLGYAEGEALSLTQLALSASYADEPATALRWARLAAQIDAGRVPDTVARKVSLVLTIALMEGGEFAAARAACARGLESARAAGDVSRQADFLCFTTRLALRAGQLGDAGAPIRESLRLTAQAGDPIRVLDCLDDCAELCAATGRWADAVTLWAARSTHRVALEIPDLAQDARQREQPLRRATRRLGERGVDQAERRGAAMTLDTAAQFASMLAVPNPRGLNPPGGAWSLTPRERELLTLVAQGRTDAQIADTLVISIRTVRSHLDRIRDKSGSRRRADLTRLALDEGLV